METQLLTPAEAASYLRRTVALLKIWRSKKKGPDYLKLEGRIFYRKSQLDEFLRAAEVKLDNS